MRARSPKSRWRVGVECVVAEDPAQRELSAAVIREPQPIGGLRIEPLWPGPLVAVPASHPQAAAKLVEPAKLDLPCC